MMAQISPPLFSNYDYTPYPWTLRWSGFDSSLTGNDCREIGNEGASWKGGVAAKSHVDCSA